MRSLFWIGIITLITFGCATKKYVGTEIEESEIRTQKQMEELKRVVEETQTEIRDLAEELDLKLDSIDDNTKTLSDRAEVAEQQIAKLGHLSFRKTLSDAEAYFRSDNTDLNEEAREELDKFAELIQAQNRMLHLEIQGHTDSRGSESYNKKLGEARAIAVREYLYKEHDIPLHLINIISMGSEDPVADNGTREGRAQNRRVVLVVRLRM